MSDRSPKRRKGLDLLAKKVIDSMVDERDIDCMSKMVGILKLIYEIEEEEKELVVSQTTSSTASTCSASSSTQTNTVAETPQKESKSLPSSSKKSSRSSKGRPSFTEKEIQTMNKVFLEDNNPSKEKINFLTDTFNINRVIPLIARQLTGRFAYLRSLKNEKTKEPDQNRKRRMIESDDEAEDE